MTKVSFFLFLQINLPSRVSASQHIFPRLTSAVSSLLSCTILCNIIPPVYTISFLARSTLLIMRPYAFLAAAAPLVLAIPAPIPAPVAAPAPKPLPILQGVETDPITGLVSGLISGALSLGSLSSAVPATISDLANALDAAGVVTRKFSTPPVAGSLPTNMQRRSPTARFSEPTFLQSCRSSFRPLSPLHRRRVSRKLKARLPVLLESPVRVQLHQLNRIFCKMLSRCFWMGSHPAICKL